MGGKAMVEERAWSTTRVTGLILILAGVVALAGVVMFSIRGGASGGGPPERVFFTVERSLFTAAIILTAAGCLLLARHLRGTRGHTLALAGAGIYAVAALLLLAAEWLNWSQSPGAGLNQAQFPYYSTLVVPGTVLSYLAQAAIGAALVRAPLRPAWVGWATIVWNIGLLAVVLVVTPGDIYYPLAHHLMPLLIGVALLRAAP